MKKIEATPGNVMTMARFMAEKLIKAEWQRQGIKVRYVEVAGLRQAAWAYLMEHREELVAEARVRLDEINRSAAR